MTTQPFTLAHSARRRAHVHHWSRLPDAIGLFGCTGCDASAVCPGCLNSLNVALVAADAGFTVVWCNDHETGALGSAPCQLG